MGLAADGRRDALVPRLLQYSMLYFEARDVMAFFGRKLSGNFQGDLVSPLPGDLRTDKRPSSYGKSPTRASTPRLPDLDRVFAKRKEDTQKESILWWQI